MNAQYAAGFFDGEGCVRHDGESLRVSITNTYRPVLEDFMRAWGGSVRTHELNTHRPDHRTSYRWEINGRPAVLFLLDIWPFSREKKAQMEASMAVKWMDNSMERENVHKNLRDLKHKESL